MGKDFVGKTPMYVSNVNPRKEGKGEGMRLASDIKVRFQAPRIIMDMLVPDQKKWSDQFFSEDGGIRLTQLFPLRVYKKIEQMRVLIYLGTNKPMEFAPATISGGDGGIQITPTDGGYCDVVCTLQVHPTVQESGKLDALAKEMVDIEILAGDIEDAGAEAGDGEGAEAA